MSKEENTLLEENSKQKKQIEFLQKQCRKAGVAILDQEVQIGGLKKDIDRLAEENRNIRIMYDKK